VRGLRGGFDRGPSNTFGRAALALGLASLIPVAGALMAVLATAVGAVGAVLASRNPERWTGRRQILAGLVLAVVGLVLFFAEGALFLRWKVDQSYDQKIAVSRLRMVEMGQALERYREDHGSYPQLSGIMNLRALLEPRYLQDCPVLDAFDQPISVDCRPSGFTLSCTPPPRQNGGRPVAPIAVHGTFQPAPSPQVLPPDFIGPPAPPGLSAALPTARQETPATIPPGGQAAAPTAPPAP
jgi:hypothetical protein